MLDEVKNNVEETVEDDAAISEAASSAAAEKSLEEKVKEKMADVFGSEDDTEVKDDKKVTDSDDEDDRKVTDSDDEVKDETNKEVTDDTTSEDEKKTEDDTLTLPASHIQTASRLGISEDKVKELFDKDPEFMISALEALHVGENKLSTQYAQMGRAKVADQMAKIKATTSDEESSSESFVDLKKLRDRFDDDDEEAKTLIDGVIKPLNDALVKLQKQVDGQAQPANDQPAYSQQEDRAVQSEVNNFFDNDKLKSFQEYYGTVKPGEDPRTVLTGIQFKHRREVCSEGNFIRIGADVAGEKLAVSDVLQRAHLQLTESMREETVRKELSSKIKKRANGLSVKVGTKQVPKTPSAKDDATQLEAKVKAGLKKVFG